MWDRAWPARASVTFVTSALCCAGLLGACAGGGGSAQSSQDAGPTRTAEARAAAIATATAIAAIPTTFASVPQSVARGEKTQITMHTKPRARCDIAIAYKSGPANLDQPGPQRADNDGNVMWSWTVNAAAPPGQASAIVNCDYDVVQTSFTVT